MSDKVYITSQKKSFLCRKSSFLRWKNFKIQKGTIYNKKKENNAKLLENLKAG